MSINKVILSGRLGRDVELRQTPNGKEVATFSLAVTDNFNREITHWINIVVWNKQAEHCANYLSKGSHVAIEGRLNTRSYENKEGRKVNITEIVADRVEFLDSKGKGKSDDDNSWDNLGRDIDLDEPPF